MTINIQRSKIPQTQPPSCIDHTLQRPNGKITTSSESQISQVEGEQGAFCCGIDFGEKIEFGVGESGAVYEMEFRADEDGLFE